GDERPGGDHAGRWLRPHRRGVGGEGSAAQRGRQARDARARPRRSGAQGQGLPSAGRRYRPGPQGQHVLRVRRGQEARGLPAGQGDQRPRGHHHRGRLHRQGHPAAGERRHRRSGELLLMTPLETVERIRDAHLKDYYRTLRKHRWLVCGLFLATVLTVGIYSFVQTPIYQATATVLIEPEPPKVLNIQEVSPIGSPTQDYYRTQYEIITSRPIIEKVIETLNLRKRMPGLDRAADPARTFLGGVTIEPKRNTRLVLVRFDSSDPTLAAEVANALARQYAKHNLDIKLKGAQEALAWLTEQMNTLRAKVQESSVALQNYRVKVGIMGLQEQRQITAQKIMDFNKQYLESQAQRLSVEAKMNELQRVTGSGGAQTIFTVADSLLIQKLKQEASELEVTKAKLSKTYKDKHPEILKVDAQIEQVSQRIDAEIKNMMRAVQTEFRVARAREETLLGNVNRLRTEAQELNEKEIQYLNLQRD